MQAQNHLCAPDIMLRAIWPLAASYVGRLAPTMGPPSSTHSEVDIASRSSSYLVLETPGAAASCGATFRNMHCRASAKSRIPPIRAACSASSMGSRLGTLLMRSSAAGRFAMAQWGRGGALTLARQPLSARGIPSAGRGNQRCRAFLWSAITARSTERTEPRSFNAVSPIEGTQARSLNFQNSEKCSPIEGTKHSPQNEHVVFRVRFAASVLFLR